MNKKLSCIIVGAGHRALGYTGAYPDVIDVIGVADPSARDMRKTP